MNPLQQAQTSACPGIYIYRHRLSWPSTQITHVLLVHAGFSLGQMQQPNGEPVLESEGLALLWAVHSLVDRSP
jgi:hypothetical protein